MLYGWDRQALSYRIALWTGPFFCESPFLFNFMIFLVLFCACRHASFKHHLTCFEERLISLLWYIGILRDDHLSYPDRLELWKEFNICWLAVCQKQKDLTQEYIAGHQSSQVSLLPRDRMESMGKALIQLCDQLEQHGLVDYQMGIWEEEILCGKFTTLILPNKPRLTISQSN